MKKINYIIYLISISLCCVHCKSENIKLTAEQTLYPLEQTVFVNNLSQYINETEIIQIEESEKSFVSDVGKMLIDKRGNLFLLSMGGNLTVLKSDGSFFRTFTEKGKGPKEYLRINDIAISEENEELMVLDEGKVMFYGISDSTKFREIKTPLMRPFDAIAPSREGGAYLFSAYSSNSEDFEKERDNLLVKIDRNGNIIGEYLRRNDCTFSLLNITQLINNNYIIRPQDNNHIAYMLTPDSILPLYKIDFKEKTIPERYFYKNANEDISLYMKADYYKMPMCFHKTENNLIFKAAGPMANEWSFLYSLKENKGIHWIDNRDDPFIPIIASDSRYFYSIITGTDLQAYNRETPDVHGPLFKFIAEKVLNDKTINRDNNNPIIVKFNFKL